MKWMFLTGICVVLIKVKAFTSKEIKRKCIYKNNKQNH